MKKINSSIDRFCARHPRFGIPNLMLFIVIGNVIVYLFSMMDRSGYFTYYLYFNPQLILHGQIWRLITFVFVPESSNIFFLFISLYFYYFIGNTLENQWGSAKFTLYYILGIVLTVIYGMIAGLISSSSYTMYIGASYINLSMFFAFATNYPDNRVLLFFIIPIKIKWLAYVDAAYFLFAMITTPFPLTFLPLVALLNYFIFCGDLLWEYLQGLKWKIKSRSRNGSTWRRNNVVDFKGAQKKAKSEYVGKPYTRKCAVCGRTDADYPNLEFRYCSKCTGYHCFCADHINNHIHFTD